tara:strand:- start:496 stop:984 length:489 start_codon:yes stop_codon:yes gene_type:complete
MEKNIKISIGILLALAVSRFIPHPPNFTSLIALSFYVPALLGLKFLPFVLFSFIFTDIIIGFHNTLFFTWGSVLTIGMLSKYIYGSTFKRLCGACIGALLFFIITNFGVWLSGLYGYNLEGIIKCYVLAIPFFGYTLISTLLFSLVIETVYKYRNFYKKLTP